MINMKRYKNVIPDSEIKNTKAKSYICESEFSTDFELVKKYYCFK